MMKIKLKQDKTIREQRIRIGGVPTLLLRPASVPSVRVGLLWIHGGGYFTGMKEMVYMGRAVDLVKKYGVTVLSPGYRLSWFQPYPAALKDCFKVLSFMEKQKEKLGIDHIMIGGESAGGGLTAALCMLARDRGIPVSFQMPLYPMLSSLDTESSRNNHGKVWNTKMNHLGWKLYLRGDANKKVSPYASPAQQTDYRNLPPCYTFVGDGEPFYAETLKYVAALRAAGVEADVDIYHTNLHAFDMLAPKKKISRQAVAVFEKHFEDALKKTLSSS